MSITNFEDHTEDLTELEKQYLPDVEVALELCLKGNGDLIEFGRDNYPKPVKQPKVVKFINEYLITKHGLFNSMKLNTVRLRKYFNYFRSNGILPIVATSDGCYITNNKEEIRRQIKSLNERARQINRAAVGLEKFL